jgi:hypothetical protein
MESKGRVDRTQVFHALMELIGDNEQASFQASRTAKKKREVMAELQGKVPPWTDDFVNGKLGRFPNKEWGWYWANPL